jgi:tetratricopeptide (TPR) repeat protein
LSIRCIARHYDINGNVYSGEEEEAPLNSLLSASSFHWLFERLQDLTEIRFSRRQDDLLIAKLSNEDLVSLGVRVKRIVVAPFVQALKDQGRLMEAEAFYRKELEMRECALGTHHPSVANSLENFAIHLEQMKKYEEAEEMLRQALDIRERICDSSPSESSKEKDSLVQRREEAQLDLAQTCGLLAQLKKYDCIHVRLQTSTNDLPFSGTAESLVQQTRSSRKLGG